MVSLRAALDRHFEAIFMAVSWVNGSVLAWVAGRPWLGAVGLITVLPGLVAYLVVHRRSGKGGPV